MDNRFNKIFDIVGNKIESAIKAENFGLENIKEIRITAGKPVQVVTKNKKIFLKKTEPDLSDIKDYFSAFCEYSVHTYQNEICEGFITSEGGIRIGLCGTAVYHNGKISNIKNISALNIRIPHEMKGISKPLEPYFDYGTLIIGPPCSGKTTLLRDYSRAASLNRNIIIVDERMEISGTYRGIPSFDIGNAAVLNGFIKSDGLITAVRSMSPDIIVCDEFGDINDIESALYAMKSGVKIAASMHASDPYDFKSKPFVKELLKYDIFRYFIFLNKNCEIYKILKTEDLAV